LTRYRSVCPDVKVSIVLDATRRIAPALLEGKLDVGITTAPIRDRRLCAEPLFEDELLVVMSPDHRLSARAWIGAADLADEHLISYDFPIEDNIMLNRFFKPSKLMPKSVSRVPLTEAIIDMVKAGLGVSVLARWAVALHLQAGTVYGRPITNSGVHRKWHIVMLRGASKQPHQVHFVRALRAQLRRNGVDRREKPVQSAVR
jgi:LysR family transcriptional regulator for metE and metH